MPHGRKFHEAASKTDAQVEWGGYDTEGHDWTLPPNRVDFWGRIEKFLGKHIGKDSAAAKKE